MDGDIPKTKERSSMSSTPKSKRSPTKFEAEHHFFKLRDEVTTLMLLDFGFSQEKYQKQIDKYRASHQSAVNVDEVVERYKKKCDSFSRWFIDKECDTVSDLLRKISVEFTMGNSIYPSDTPAKIAEYCQRRKHINEAIACCYALKQEVQYVIRTLPVDINKFKRYSVMIDEQIALYKGVRQADNRSLKNKKK